MPAVVLPEAARAGAIGVLCLGWVAAAGLWAARRAARGNERRLERVTELATDAIVVINSSAEIISWNAGAQAMFGYAADEACGRKIWSMFPPGHEHDYAAMFHMVVEGTVPLPRRPVEIQSGHRSGVTFPVELSVSSWTEGGEVYVGCIFRDVSQRREMEERLRASTELFESVLNGATQSSIIGTDERGVVTVFNRGAERLLGYSADEARGVLDLLAFHDPAEITARALALGVPATIEALVAAARRGEAETREWTYLRKDGSRVPVSLTLTGMRHNGALRGFIAVAHDLSAVRRAERRMEWANEAFRAAFDSAPVAVLLTTAEMKCSHANPAFCELTGYSVDALREMNMLDFLVRDDTTPFDELLEEESARFAHVLHGDHTTQRAERQIRRADGTEVWVREHTSVVTNSDGTPILFVTHLEDITHEQEVQNALREALSRKIEALNRLEEIDRAKSDFVSMVSHELRSPITSIIGYLELLRDGSYGEIGAGQSDALEIVERNAARLQHLVTDLMMLQKLESGQEERLELLPLDIQTVVRYVSDSLRPIMAKRRQEFVLEVPATVPAVMGIERYVEHIVSNLMTNAIKFTPEGGRIAISVEARGAHVFIAVRDTGIGIPADELPKVFTRFYRGRRDEVTNVQGTGLGLSIVRAMVRQLDADIRIESEVGVGTCVTLVLRAAEPAHALASASNSEARL